MGRVNFRDAENLDRLLTQFVSYESREVREFREAIEAFTRDIPALGEMLRSAIGDQFEQNAKFQKAAKELLELCQEAINPSMEMADVREMIVQHVLTEDIFVTVFDEPQFHRENIIAHELGQVVGTFYSGQVRRQIDARIEGYTLAIKARAAQIYKSTRKNSNSSRCSTKTSTGRTTPKPPTAWASSTPPTRLCACGSTYEWQVRAICTDGGASAYSDVLSFTTLSCKEASETSFEQPPIIYASGKDIYIDFEALNEDATIQIFDLNGKLLLEEISTEINTVIRTNLPAGIYLTRIIINEEMFTEKIVLKSLFRLIYYQVPEIFLGVNNMLGHNWVQNYLRIIAGFYCLFIFFRV